MEMAPLTIRQSCRATIPFPRSPAARLMSLPVLDRRLTPARADRAAAALRGRVEAASFVEARLRGVIEAVAPLRRAPAPDAPLETEALYGEAVAVYDESQGWAWVQLLRDSYVGYLPASALGAPTAATHRLAALRSFAYPGPSIKTPPALALSLGAQLAVKSHQGEFFVTGDGLHLYAQHLAAIDAFEPDFVAVAERFLEAPYLWGGRTSVGLDCSGLVQSALAAAGVKAPRDADMMEAGLGAPVAFDESLSGLARGDLIFWKGHVGVMQDARTLLHASGWHMKVVSERLRVTCGRINEKAGGPITSIRRL